MASVRGGTSATAKRDATMAAPTCTPVAAAASEGEVQSFSSQTSETICCPNAA